MTKLRLLSLFSGIGAFEKALGNIGIDFELVNYCEINKTASTAFSLIHNVDETLNLVDVTAVNTETLGDFDLMTYGFPCQDLSALGSMKGLTAEDGSLTRSGLFFEAMRIAEAKKPKYMIAENVKMLVSKKFSEQFSEMKALLDRLGYNTYVKTLNSKDYGIPHSRQRVFIVSIRKDVDQVFEFPEPVPLTSVASDFYDDTAPEELYISGKQFDYVSEFRLKKKYSSLNADIIICQTTKQGNLSNPQNYIQDDKGTRVLTARELLALQGFDKADADKLTTYGLSNSQVGTLSGNSITVTVLERLFVELFRGTEYNAKSTQQEAE